MASKLPMVLILFVMALFAVTFQCCSSDTSNYYSLEEYSKKIDQPQAPRFGSTAVFPVSGSVAAGYYSVSTCIGNPPKPYTLDIDTGSSLSWIQCDAPCIQCNPAPHPLYRPPLNKIVLCGDPICNEVHHPPNYPCRGPTDRCHYIIKYEDGGESTGFLVRDSFPLRFTTGLQSSPSLVFGCGFKQVTPPENPVGHTDGVLGLSPSNEMSIVRQLQKHSLTQNVFGHCFRNPKDGYFFIGAHIAHPPETVFARLPPQLRSEEIYSPGFGDLVSDGQITNIKIVKIIFDSGTTYTYFKHEAYQAMVSIIRRNLRTMPLTTVSDPDFPVCWRGPKVHTSVYEVKGYFKNFGIVFSQVNNVQFQLPPEAYLIISPSGNVCFAILDSTDLGGINLIGDISMQNKLVIYDNERNLIGWGPSNCNNPTRG